MPATAFITNSKARTLKKLLAELIQHNKRGEKFLCEIGIDPAESTSRNPLESPWVLPKEEFVRRVGQESLKAYNSTREETISLTEEIVRVEREIDERVKSLYGL